LIDYRILKIFMEGLPLNEERLWVLRDLIAVPFVALGVYKGVSWLRASLRAPTLSILSASSLKASSKHRTLYVLGWILALNILIPGVLGGWLIASLGAAYPQVAPLQTTWYELEAVRYIEENTHEKYVVIGDVWTIFAGEVIVGVNNPRAYYFLEFNKTGYNLFFHMSQDPSSHWMLVAMNYTDTTRAYFIITEPRVGPEEYNRIVTQALESDIQVYGVFGEERLHVFYYDKELHVQ
jgi:hypothetical protein